MQQDQARLAVVQLDGGRLQLRACINRLHERFAKQKGFVASNQCGCCSSPCLHEATTLTNAGSKHIIQVTCCQPTQSRHNAQHQAPIRFHEHLAISTPGKRRINKQNLLKHLGSKTGAAVVFVRPYFFLGLGCPHRVQNIRCIVFSTMRPKPLSTQSNATPLMLES